MRTGDIEEKNLKSMRLMREVMVPMRDGLRLAANVYLPVGEGPFPVVVVRNPYHRVRSRTDIRVCVRTSLDITSVSPGRR